MVLRANLFFSKLLPNNKTLWGQEISHPRGCQISSKTNQLLKLKKLLRKWQLKLRQQLLLWPPLPKSAKYLLKLDGPNLRQNWKKRHNRSKWHKMHRRPHQHLSQILDQSSQSLFQPRLRSSRICLPEMHLCQCRRRIQKPSIHKLLRLRKKSLQPKPQIINI